MRSGKGSGKTMTLSVSFLAVNSTTAALTFSREKVALKTLPQVDPGPSSRATKVSRASFLFLLILLVADCV